MTPHDAISLLFPPGQVVELRIIDDGIGSGYYQDHEKLAADVQLVEGTKPQGIYVTLNEVDPALLSRRSNRFKMRLSKKDATTADSDIVHRRWFPVDIDPKRPSGVSSSDEEHQGALTRAEEIKAFLMATHGWPDPIVADSGNGAHLLYRIDLPNDDASRDLVKRCLEVLAVIFDDGKNLIDTANFNAGRIWKLYGTISRKGDDTPERPHRRSAILDAGSNQVVSVDLLKCLAGSMPDTSTVAGAEKKPGRPGRALDLGSWLRDHGIGYTNEKPYQGGTLYPLDECPFSGAHKDGAFAIQFPNGAIYAGCHHNSCGGGSQRWSELRSMYETVETGRDPGRTASGLTKTGPRAPGPSPSPGIDLPYRDSAMTILRIGDPIQGMLSCFAKYHEGDEVLAECLIMSLASRSVINTNGLHVSVTGESGKGKSHAFKTMLQQVPERYRLAGRMSNKALFYINDLSPGSVIVLDDMMLSEEMGEILKGVTTSFLEPFVYRTVSKDRKGQICIIPERCIWWVAKVEGVGDDQVFNRMLTCWIDDSIEQDTRVLSRILKRDVAIPRSKPAEREDIAVCQAMWEILGDQRIHVIIPYAEQIRFPDIANRRNPEMILDLIKAYAVLRFMQRMKIDTEGITCIYATEDDFNAAAKLYKLLNGVAGGQSTKLTKTESRILFTVAKKCWPEFTIAMLQKELEISNGTLHRHLHGYNARGTSYTGLLEKCPAIAYTDRTVVCEEDGVSIRRRSHAYTFDRRIYESWKRGGSAWIEGMITSVQSPSQTDQFPAVPNNSSTNVGSKNIVAASSESDNLSTNTHLDLRDQVLFYKSDLTSRKIINSDQLSPSLCDPEFVEEQKVISSNCIRITEPSPKIIPLSPNTVEGFDENGGNSPLLLGTVGNNGNGKNNPAAKVYARDFKKLPYPDSEPCVICGKKSDSWYIEKLTERRRKLPADTTPWYLCQRCYQKAVRIHQDAIVLLPETIQVQDLEQVRVDLGRCNICTLEKAVWKDRTRDLKVCEYCYQRALRINDQKSSAGLV